MEYLMMAPLVAPIVQTAVETVKYDIFGAERPEITAQKLQAQQQTKLMEEQTKQQEALLDKEQKIAESLEFQRQIREDTMREKMPQYLKDIAQAEAEGVKKKTVAISETFDELTKKHGPVVARTLLSALSYGSPQDGGLKSAVDLIPQQTPITTSPIIARPMPLPTPPPIEWKNQKSLTPYDASSGMIQYLQFKQREKVLQKGQSEILDAHKKLKEEAQQQKELVIQSRGKLQEAEQSLINLKKEADFLKLPEDEKIEILRKEYEKYPLDKRFEKFETVKKPYEKEAIIYSITNSMPISDHFMKVEKKLPNILEQFNVKMTQQDVKNYEDIVNIPNFKPKLYDTINNFVGYGKPSQDLSPTVFETAQPGKGNLQNREKIINRINEIRETKPDYYNYFVDNINKSLLIKLGRPENKGERGLYKGMDPLSPNKIKRFLKQ